MQIKKWFTLTFEKTVSISVLANTKQAETTASVSIDVPDVDVAHAITQADDQGWRFRDIEPINLKEAEARDRYVNSGPK